MPLPIEKQNCPRQWSTYYNMQAQCIFAPWNVDSRGANAQGGCVHCTLRPMCEWVGCNLWLRNRANTMTMLKDYHNNVAYISLVYAITGQTSSLSNFPRVVTFKGLCSQDKMYCISEGFTRMARDCASYLISKLQNLDIQYKEMVFFSNRNSSQYSPI